MGLSLSRALTDRFGLPALPWGAFDIDPSEDKLYQILIPEKEVAQNDETVSITMDLKHTTTFPLHVKGKSPNALGIIPLELMAILRTGLTQDIKYDASQQTFVLADLAFRAFRLYANSLDNVIPLAEELRNQGIQVIAAEKKIHDILSLDKGMTRIFWLVAILGIIGGLSSLIASLYASVQRKTQELGILRLIGFSRIEVARFPIYQSFAMSLLSVLLAILGYFVFSYIINTVFASDLDQIRGQKICWLPASYLVMAILITTFIGIVSSLLAAWKTTKIDPAEALRAE